MQLTRVKTRGLMLIIPVALVAAVFGGCRELTRYLDLKNADILARAERQLIQDAVEFEREADRLGSSDQLQASGCAQLAKAYRANAAVHARLRRELLKRWQ